MLSHLFQSARRPTDIGIPASLSRRNNRCWTPPFDFWESSAQIIACCLEGKKQWAHQGRNWLGFVSEINKKPIFATKIFCLSSMKIIFSTGVDCPLVAGQWDDIFFEFSSSLAPDVWPFLSLIVFWCGTHVWACGCGLHVICGKRQTVCGTKTHTQWVKECGFPLVRSMVSSQSKLGCKQCQHCCCCCHCDSDNEFFLQQFQQNQRCAHMQAQLRNCMTAPGHTLISTSGGTKKVTISLSSMPLMDATDGCFGLSRGTPTSWWISDTEICNASNIKDQLKSLHCHQAVRCLVLIANCPMWAMGCLLEPLQIWVRISCFCASQGDSINLHLSIRCSNMHTFHCGGNEPLTGIFAEILVERFHSQSQILDSKFIGQNCDLTNGICCWHVEDNMCRRLARTATTTTCHAGGGWQLVLGKTTTTKRVKWTRFTSKDTKKTASKNRNGWLEFVVHNRKQEKHPWTKVSCCGCFQTRSTKMTENDDWNFVILGRKKTKQNNLVVLVFQSNLLSTLFLPWRMNQRIRSSKLHHSFPLSDRRLLIKSDWRFFWRAFHPALCDTPNCDVQNLELEAILKKYTRSQNESQKPFRSLQNIVFDDELKIFFTCQRLRQNGLLILSNVTTSHFMRDVENPNV